jgi:F420-dependent oxidoreductase-like protein
MKLGLHISNFSWSDGAPALARRLGEIASTAESVGYDRISVMDHVWQISVNGEPEEPMLEAYTALGFLAAHTSRVSLMTLVTGVTYRDPGLLAKQVTTLDVLSGGRAWLGIGAAWNGEESAGLGLHFPPTAERFERLEEAIQICLQMWTDGEGPYAGKHYQLGRTLNSPQSLARPHPPILIGGSGERKTLRFVAKYAQACNLFGGPEVDHKLDVLRQHCANEGRDYDDIEKTVNYRIEVGPNGENVPQVIDELKALADKGISVAHGRVYDVESIKPLEIIGRDIIPAIADF